LEKCIKIKRKFDEKWNRRSEKRKLGEIQGKSWENPSDLI